MRVNRILLFITLALAAAPSCSSPHKYDLTLRYRGDVQTLWRWCARAVDGPDCVPSRRLANPSCKVREVTGLTSKLTCAQRLDTTRWTGADGRQATEPAHTLGDAFVKIIESPECNGQQFQEVIVLHRDPSVTIPVDQRTSEFQIDDGNVLHIAYETSLYVLDQAGVNFQCVTVTGTWRGLDGALRGHTGTYTLTFDKIQWMIHIVEN